MSGLEVVAVVAAVVSAFHGGAELISLYKERRERMRQRRRQQQQASQHQHQRQAAQEYHDYQEQFFQNLLHESMQAGEMQIGLRFVEEQRALGHRSQLLRYGDDRARQELLMIAVSLQAEIINILGHAKSRSNEDAVVEIVQMRSMHELAIAKKLEAVRSIHELRQRIEFKLPVARQPADIVMGLSRRSSNESLARSFVTAAANLAVAQQLPLPSVPVGINNRGYGPSRAAPTTTIASYSYIIPPITAHDIEILTLAGQPIEHGESAACRHDFVQPGIEAVQQVTDANSSSPATITPESASRPAQLLEAAGPWFPSSAPNTTSTASPPLPNAAAQRDRASLPQTFFRRPSDRSDAMQWASRAASVPAMQGSPTLSEPDAASLFRPDSCSLYCSGALTAQDDFGAGFSRHLLPSLPGSEKVQTCWKCNECDFNAADGDGQLLEHIHFKHGVRFRWSYLARSHLAYYHPADALRSRYTYGCLFCTAEGRRSAVFDGVENLMSHINSRHKTNLTPNVRHKTRCMVGALPGREEDWDVNMPDVKSSGGAFGKWVLHAVTSLPT